MKIYLILIALLSIHKIESFKSLYNLNNLNNIWTSFKQHNFKTYKNENEEIFRKQTFTNNLMLINDHNNEFNKGKSTFTLDINKFADWTVDEFKAYVNKGLNKIPVREKSKFELDLKAHNIPLEKDWRDIGIINPIKDQGGCGSCWSFSAVGVVEPFSALASKSSPPQLSEQNLVDCVGKYFNNTSTAIDGCQGGLEEDAMTYIQVKGIELNATYPYISGLTGKRNSRCRNNLNKKSSTKVTGYKTIEPINNDAITNALAEIGPLSIALCVVDNFMFYSEGIYNSQDCSNDLNSLNHAVVLVGYNMTDPANSYFLLRNSWGTSWGIDGYMQFDMNPFNMCGIALDVIFPNVLVNGKEYP